MSLSLTPFEPAVGAAASAHAPHTRVSIVDSEEQQIADSADNLYIRTEEKQPLPPPAAAASAAAASSSSNSAAASSSSSSTAASSSGANAVDLNAPFQLLADARFSKDTHPAMRRYFQKWNIDQTCSMNKWRYIKSNSNNAEVERMRWSTANSRAWTHRAVSVFCVCALLLLSPHHSSLLSAVDFNDPSSLQSFLVSFLNSGAFRGAFRCYSSGSRSMMPLAPGVEVAKVTLAASGLRATLVDLHAFDRLWTESPSVVYGSIEEALPELSDAVSAGGTSEDDTSSGMSSADGNGAIRKCFEDVVDGVPVADELRRVLLDRDSDNFEMYSPAERSELLFQLFSHLAIGGGLNQYENNVQPYLACLKLLYKDMVAVRTNRNTNQLEVASLVYKISGLTGDDDKTLPLFGAKDKDKHHLCILSIDPQKRHVTCYYFAHTSAW